MRSCTYKTQYETNQGGEPCDRHACSIERATTYIGSFDSLSALFLRYTLDSVYTCIHPFFQYYCSTWVYINLVPRTPTPCKLLLKYFLVQTNQAIINLYSLFRSTSLLTILRMVDDNDVKGKELDMWSHCGLYYCNRHTYV